MDIFNRTENDRLRSLADTLASRNEQLMTEVAELKEFKLKYKIAKMYIDDDEAVDELLAAHKVKEVAIDGRYDISIGMQSQLQKNMALSQLGGVGLLSGQQLSAGLQGVGILGMQGAGGFGMLGH